MLYAIIENGGKQYKAIEGGFIEVDRLTTEVGKKITLKNVLLVADDNGARVGTPLLKEVDVNATVVVHFKGPKITIFKYRPKERYRKKTGHRQLYTRLLVDSIIYPGKTKSVKKEESKQVEMRVKEKPQAKAASKKPAIKAKDTSSKRTGGKKIK